MPDKITTQTFDRIIKANSMKNYWTNFWHHREVLYILSYRDIAVRYKQTILGYVWAFLKPLFTMIALTIVFDKIAKLPSGGMPYPVLVLSGIVPWYFFSNTLVDISNSIVNNKAMVSKIYFPRMFLPFSSLGVGLVDVAISLLLLLLFMLFYGVTLSITMLVLPFVIFLAMMICTGIGLFFSALNAQYRDVQFIIPFLIQFGLYISPVGFSADLVPEKWRLLYSLNPMVGVIDGFRWAVSGGETFVYLPGLLVSIIIAISAAFLGTKYFQHVERKFADVI